MRRASRGCGGGLESLVPGKLALAFVSLLRGRGREATVSSIRDLWPHDEGCVGCEAGHVLGVLGFGVADLVEGFHEGDHGVCGGRGEGGVGGDFVGHFDLVVWMKLNIDCLFGE
jgi:hypothetical protein